MFIKNSSQLKLRTILLILLLIFFILSPTVSLAGDYEFNFFGINPKWFKNKKWSHIVIGAVASFAVHELGHIVVSQNKSGWHGRAGFVAQAAIGTALNLIPKTRGSDFVIGFNALSFGEVLTYPLRRQGTGDFDIIDNYGGNAQVEYAIYSTIGFFNTGFSVYLNSNLLPPVPFGEIIDININK